MQSLELELKDNLSINLNYLTSKDVTGLFKLEQMGSWPYEKDDNVWISINIERCLSLHKIERCVYNSFDFLSDVGGLSGILVSGLWFFVNAWNHNSFDNFMVANLFKMKKPDDRHAKKKNELEKI